MATARLKKDGMTVCEAWATIIFTTASGASRWQLRMLEPPRHLVMPSSTMMRLRSAGSNASSSAFTSVIPPSVTAWYIQS